MTHDTASNRPPAPPDESSDAPPVEAARGSSGAAGITRRALLAGAAAATGGAVLDALPLTAATAPVQAPSAQPTLPPAVPPVPLDATKVPGTPTTSVGVRSAFVTPERAPIGVMGGASFTPLQELVGTITPSDLHFERHHAGVAHVDPARYKLMVHGLADRATVFTLEDLKRLPSVTRTHFIECAGNGRTGYRAPKREFTPQVLDGMTSNSEWTGVPLATLLSEVGVTSAAKWILAEGGDAVVLSRSVPIAKAMDDALIAYAQNGEPLRPAQGYPVRLVLPGWEGNMCIKWLRRLEAIAQPNMSRDETAKYTDPLPNDTARQFSFVLDAKSTITYPTYPVRLPGRGWVQISGLAWSGRGKIARVDVSTDGGTTWTAAEVQGPILPKAHTRFQLMWDWDGRPATIMSRAVDETGGVQPTLAEFRATRGPGTDYHFNHIRAWVIESDGRVYYGVDL